MKRPIWIDTDCGVDDALALLCACRLETVEIVGVSAGVGTTVRENTFRNTRNVLALGGRKDIPVYPGSETAWIEPYMPAPDFHGEDGLGGALIPESDAPIYTKHAWDAMRDAAKKYSGELVIITIGQLTDVANAIVKYPDFVNDVKEIDIMGGAMIGGNTTIASEANIRRDPHAAQCVYKSGIPIVMFGLDVTEKAFLTEGDLDEIYGKGTNVTKMMETAMRFAVNTNIRDTGRKYYDLHDLCPVIYQDYPELFKGVKAGVYVETRSPVTMGKTITDRYTLMDQRLPAKNVFVMEEVDRERMVEIVKGMLLSFD